LAKVFTTAGLMFGFGAILILWGLYVLLTGDFVATLDIAAGLVGWGVGAIGIGAVIRSLNDIAAGLAGRAPAAADFVEDVVFAEESLPPPEPEPEPVLPVTRPALKQPPQPPQPPRKLPPMPEEEAAVPEPGAPAGPALVREGVIEGRRYRFYSDGSIEAEGPDGLRRYRSIDEARKQILRERSEREDKTAPSRPAAPEPPSVPPSAPPAPSSALRPSAGGPPRPAANIPARPAIHPQPSAQTPPEFVARSVETKRPPAQQQAPKDAAPKAGGESVTWESYLAAGSAPQPSRANPEPPPTPDDEEWAEPFRMLLRGGGPAGAADESEPKKR